MTASNQSYSIPDIHCFKYATRFVGFFLFLLFVVFVFWLFRATPKKHIDVPRLGAELELQLPAYAIATATQDPRHICDLYHSSWQQCQILNPLNEARD